MHTTKLLLTVFGIAALLFGSLFASDPIQTTTNYSVDAIQIWTDQMMDKDPAKVNPDGKPVRYGTKAEPGSENIVRWCLQNAEDWMQINSEDPASGPYSMTISVGGERIPKDNCWLDMRRPDAPVAGYNVPLDAGGTDRVTFWIKAEPGTAPLWFLAQSFPPDFDGTTYSGDKQLSTQAFIDGETVIIKDGTGEIKVMRDNHFNGEWQFVSLPWEFLEMTDSTAVAEMLPWSFVWEGSAADTRDDVAFDRSKLRTIKWYTRPEGGDFLRDQYWESPDNLWGPFGMNPERCTWELDEIVFDTFNDPVVDNSLNPEVDVWTDQMMDKDPAKVNPDGKPVRYGTKAEPGSENIVRWCLQNAEDWMQINSEDPAAGPYSMTISIGGERIPKDNCWLDLRRPDAPVPGYNIPFDASNTERVTFWIKAEPGTAPLWFLAQSFPPDFDGTTYSGDKQISTQAFIDGETIIIKDGVGQLKVLRDNHFNGEWQFVSLPWEFLEMADSVAVAEMLPWSFAWEGSAADTRDDVAFDRSKLRTIKWFTRPEGGDFLRDQYWESPDNLWGPFGMNPERCTWEIDEVKFQKLNSYESSPAEIKIWDNQMMDKDPAKVNPDGKPVRYGTKAEPGSENIVRWCLQNAEDWMQINSEDPAAGPYSMTISVGGERIPKDNCWLDLRRPDAPVEGYNIPFDAGNTDRVTFWIKAEPGTAPLWFLAQSFPPDYDGTTYSGDKQISTQAFIDGETIIDINDVGELTVIRDKHFTGEWQFVSLPWAFLTMADSVAVAEMLPWSFAWEGSAADTRPDVAFDQSKLRTIKWYTRPEGGDFLRDQYWESPDNLWGPFGMNPERCTWEIDAIYLTSFYKPREGFTSGVETDRERIPAAYELYNSYPNPFNPSTTISYAIPVSNQVKVEIFNIMGQKVRTLVDNNMSAGTHNVIWDARNDAGFKVPTGIYFVNMQSSHFRSTQKVTLIK